MPSEQARPARRPRRPNTQLVCRCGKAFYRTASYLERLRHPSELHCSRACRFAHERGPESPCWRGGKRLTRNGYVDLIGVRGRGRHAVEHRRVVELAIGKPLPDGAVVHHVNGDKTDNRTSNLVVCQDQTYHAGLHARQRVLQAGGRPFADKWCCGCQAPRDAARFYKATSGECIDCARKNALARLRRKKAEVAA